MWVERERERERVKATGNDRRNREMGTLILKDTKGQDRLAIRGLPQRFMALRHL